MRLVVPLWDVLVFTFFSASLVLATAWLHRNFKD